MENKSHQLFKLSNLGELGNLPVMACNFYVGVFVSAQCYAPRVLHYGAI
jgi:hypothetical protein